MVISTQGYVVADHVERYYEYLDTLSIIGPSGEVDLFGRIIDQIIVQLKTLSMFNDDNVTKRSGYNMGGLYARVYLKSILNNQGDAPGNVNAYLTDLKFEIVVDQTFNNVTTTQGIQYFISIISQIFDVFNLDNLQGLVRKVSPEIEFSSFQDKTYNKQASAIITLCCERYLEN